VVVGVVVVGSRFSLGVVVGVAVAGGIVSEGVVVGVVVAGRVVSVNVVVGIVVVVVVTVFPLGPVETSRVTFAPRAILAPAAGLVAITCPTDMLECTEVVL
jgi:hypothetical protein